MTIFKSTQEVLLTALEDMSASQVAHKKIPPKWNNETPMQFEDVVIWEQIYGKNGISVYAAWSPYENFYIIVHGLFLDKDWSIEIYQGTSAIDSVVNRLKVFGIEVPIKEYWSAI